MARGVGQAGTVDVGEIEQMIHGLRVFEGLGFNSIDDRQVDLFFRRRKRGDQGDQRNGYEALSHGMYPSWK